MRAQFDSRPFRSMPLGQLFVLSELPDQEKEEGSQSPRIT